MIKLYQNQKKIQESLGEKIHSIEYLRNMILAATDELMEVLHESPWKPWKKPKYKTVDKNLVTKEIADVQIFLFNILYHHNIDFDDFLASVASKQSTNMGRFNNDGNFVQEDAKPKMVCEAAAECGQSGCPHNIPHNYFISCLEGTLNCMFVQRRVKCHQIPNS